MIYNIHQPLGLVAVHPVKQPNGKFIKTTLVIAEISMQQCHALGHEESVFSANGLS